MKVSKNSYADESKGGSLRQTQCVAVPVWCCPRHSHTETPSCTSPLWRGWNGLTPRVPSAEIGVHCASHLHQGSSTSSPSQPLMLGCWACFRDVQEGQCVVPRRICFLMRAGGGPSLTILFSMFT